MAAIVVITVAIAIAQSSTGIPEPVKTTDQAFKNIQILKGIPADQLIPAMQFMSSSLGVQCDFCHMEGSFDKDDKKPKLVARKMMQMMIIINRENFDSHREVTCYTCHRGAPSPVAIPIVTTEATPPFPHGLDDEHSPPNNLPPVDQILAKYVQAVGGMDAIQKISSRTARGEVSFGPRQFLVEIFIESPDQEAVVIHMPNGDNLTEFNGQEGWMSVPNRPLRAMSPADMAAARIDADVQFPADAKKIFQDLRVAREEKIGDRTAYVVIGARKGDPPVELYFDEQSGLLLREVRFGDSPLGIESYAAGFQ